MEGARALEHVAGEGLMGELYDALQAAAAGDGDAAVRAHARDALAAVDDAVERLARGAAPERAAALRAGARGVGGATLKML